MFTVSLPHWHPSCLAQLVASSLQVHSVAGSCPVASVLAEVGESEIFLQIIRTLQT